MAEPIRDTEGGRALFENIMSAKRHSLLEQLTLNIMKDT